MEQGTTLYNDLQKLYVSGVHANHGSQAGADADTLAKDVTTLYQDNSPFPAPGVEQDYNTIYADIVKLAADCGVSTAGIGPQPGGPS